MANTKQATWNDWMGADVVGSDGDKIGSLDNVYADGTGTRPAWLGVKTGFLGMRESLVPIEGVEGDGEDLRVPFTKDQVKDAPSVDPENGELDRDDESELHRHYGISAPGGGQAATGAASGATATAAAGSQRADDVGAGRADAGRDAAAAGGDTGHDKSGPDTDTAMTRSEEELAVGTRSQESGRVRLRKYVDTEQVSTTVPVRKEVARVEREPITDENRDAATSGADIHEEEHEMVLNEEEVVVDKEVVPKERVRLDKDVETEEREVSDEVRKERIEVDDDTTTG